MICTYTRERSTPRNCWICSTSELGGLQLATCVCVCVCVCVQVLDDGIEEEGERRESSTVVGHHQMCLA